MTRRARLASLTGLMVLTLALGSCGGQRMYVVDTETWFLPVPTVRDCAAARELLDSDAPTWRLHPRSARYGDHFVELRPTDELWIVEVEDYRRTLGSREGFEATVRCGNRTFELALLECSMDEGRRLFIPAHQLPAAGSQDRPCSFRLELTHGHEQWFDFTYSLVLRSGLGRWREANPHPRPPSR